MFHSLRETWVLIFVFFEHFSIMRQPVLLYVDNLIPLGKDLSYPSTFFPKVYYSSNSVGVGSIS